MSRYDVDNDYRGRTSGSYHRPRSGAGRDRSPDYYYHPGLASSAFASGAMPPPPPGGPSQARLQYEPRSPFYPPPPQDGSNSSLQVPSSRSRPRSVPPALDTAMAVRDSGRRSDARSPTRSPLNKARYAVEKAFTPSTSGLGVGVLGAIVGGLAAREVSEATARAQSGQNYHGGDHRRRSSGRDDQARDRAQLISTIVGAAVGGLGANAFEKRIEAGRLKGKEEQAAWERKWGCSGDKDDGSQPPRGTRGTRDSYGSDDRGWDRHGRSRRSFDDDDDDEDDRNDYDYVYDSPMRRRGSGDGRRFHD